MKTAAEKLAELEEIFEAIIAFPSGSAQQAEALRFSGGNTQLASQALSLAAAHLRRQALNRDANLPAQEENESGRLYGHYRTVRRIGSGGMGTVFLAERADGEYRQTVALKIIHPHLAPEIFHRRFLEERQILASLHHPGITKILDGGVTAQGTPFLVMDYVEGRPLDQYCEHNHLDLRARLDLFRKVCEAVSYAHRSLIVHRDLKPSNIVVNPDGNPVLLDFGTAKFLEAIPAEEHTAFPLLTLRYSSPEQRNRKPLTTATDVFSLGVILYELLTGKWPFGDASSPAGLMRSFGCETSMTAPTLPSDLASVLSKALSPAPVARYGSVDAFSADVNNFLLGAPVNAKPARFSYRAGKYARRHWLVLTAAIVFVWGLSAATAVALRQSKAAQEQARKAETVSSFLTGMLSSGARFQFDPKRYTVAQMLDAAAAQLEANPPGQDPVDEAELRTSLASSYIAVEEPDKARHQLPFALATYRNRGDKVGEAKALLILGASYNDSNRLEAVKLYRQSLALQKTIGKDAPPALQFNTRLNLAEDETLFHSETNEAHKLIQEAIAIARNEPSIPRPSLAVAQGLYGGVLLDEGKEAQAETVLQEALRNFGPENQNSAARTRPLFELVTLHSRRDDFPAARDFASEYYKLLFANLGPDHKATLEGLLMWQRYRADTGEAAASLAPARAAMSSLRQKYPPMSAGLWSDLRNLAHIQNAADDFRAAQLTSEEALAVYDRGTWSQADPRRAQTLFELAVALRGQHKNVEAQPLLQEALAIYNNSGPVWVRRTQQVRAMLATEK
jgi:tRNA A-37 threonylcarbamoyl transferase component Bud32/tetratricopeptide (TPR) repeat protein